MKKNELLRIFVSFQVPSLSTQYVPPIMLLERVRSWIWMTLCIWVVCRKTALAWCFPPRCGLHCLTMVTWAACVICSWMARAKTSGVLLRPKEQWVSNLPAPKNLQSSAWATHVWTVACAGRAGTATSVTAQGLVTWVAPVREVSHGFHCYCRFLSHVNRLVFTLNGCWIHFIHLGTDC